jgi:hypothetical protein
VRVGIENVALLQYLKTMIRTTLEQQAAIIERWKAKNGITGRDFVPRNSGVSRTPSKRALLKLLADLTPPGEEPIFPANF